METIGNRISKYRKAKGLTQEDLAGKLGVSSQAVSKWETDASCPDISLLSQLCSRKSLEELTLRVYVNSADGDKIKVNLPMTLVKIAMEIGVDIVPNMGGEHGDMLKSLDMKKVLQMVEQGLIGKLVEMESADGDTVEVVVE